MFVSIYLPTRLVFALSFASSSWCRNRNCPSRSSLGTAACAVGAPAVPSRNTWPAPRGSASATAQPHSYIPSKARTHRRTWGHRPQAHWHTHTLSHRKNDEKRSFCWWRLGRNKQKLSCVGQCWTRLVLVVETFCINTYGWAKVSDHLCLFSYVVRIKVIFAKYISNGFREPTKFSSWFYYRQPLKHPKEWITLAYNFLRVTSGFS